MAAIASRHLRRALERRPDSEVYSSCLLQLLLFMGDEVGEWGRGGEGMRRRRNRANVFSEGLKGVREGRGRRAEGGGWMMEGEGWRNTTIGCWLLGADWRVMVGGWRVVSGG